MPEPRDKPRVASYLQLDEIIHQLAEHWGIPGAISPSKADYEAAAGFDRETVSKTIQGLLQLGYRIESPKSVPKAADTGRTATERDRVQNTIQRNSSLEELIALWNGRDLEVWPKSAELFQSLGHAMLSRGAPILTYDVASEGLRFFPENLSLRQILALALARSGANTAAMTLLTKLIDEGHRDEETLGLLARTYKDLATEAADSDHRRENLRQAFGLYLHAYELTRGYWSGINAATLAILLDERERATALAAQVTDICKRQLAQQSRNDKDHWVFATLGEAALIDGRLPEASEWYSHAVKSASARYADVNAMRRNARLLQDSLGQNKTLIDACFHIPAIVAFVGHMMDRANRVVPRFPKELEKSVGDEIRRHLARMDAGAGYSSAACGSDILFLEAMLERNAEIHVVLPYEKEQFIADCVDLGAGSSHWRARFENVLRQAVEVIVASGQRSQDGAILYEYANTLLYGLASVHAQRLDSGLRCLAVWNGDPGDGRGGTATTVEFWKAAGEQVEVIAPPITQTPKAPERAKISSLPPSTLTREKFAPEIRALLFADAVGFSKLTEEQVLLFTENFLGLARLVMEELSTQPLAKNTWGDALYLVFSDARSAGRFALEFRDRVRQTRWSEKGLSDLDLRIGLHAGPVYRCKDALTSQVSYVGSHASRAARIEPITPPGEVYTSQAFSALVAAEHVSEFRCDYVGVTSMAKGYGNFPTYVLRRS